MKLRVVIRPGVEVDVELVRKSTSRWHRLLGRLSPGYARFWTTVGHKIGVPERLDSEPLDAAFVMRNRRVIEHEAIHVWQHVRRGAVLHVLWYLLLPFPVLFAFGRWQSEREAYLPELQALAGTNADAYEARRELIVDNLWHDYAWTWPRGRMRKWFDRHARQ